MTVNHDVIGIKPSRGTMKKAYRNFQYAFFQRYKFLRSFAICTLYTIYSDGCDMLPSTTRKRNLYCSVLFLLSSIGSNR